jgi:hypothetical protein
MAGPASTAGPVAGWPWPSRTVRSGARPAANRVSSARWARSSSWVSARTVAATGPDRSERATTRVKWCRRSSLACCSRRDAYAR